MPTLISKVDGSQYHYETAHESDQTVQLDGNRIIPGKLSDYTIEGGPLVPMTATAFYVAFQPQERIDIKSSPDPMVKEFWATFEIALQNNAPIDPNLVSVQNSVAYLAIPSTAAPPGPGILKSPARIGEILAGVPQ